jgi:hypothetical protein
MRGCDGLPFLAGGKAAHHSASTNCHSLRVFTYCPRTGSRWDRRACVGCIVSDLQRRTVVDSSVMRRRRKGRISSEVEVQKRRGSSPITRASPKGLSAARPPNHAQNGGCRVFCKRASTHHRRRLRELNVQRPNDRRLPTRHSDLPSATPDKNTTDHGGRGKGT